MARKSKKSKRRKRPERQQVRDNASRSGRGANFFSLPAGVERWIPDKAKKYHIDIVPYPIGINNHPDDIEKDMLWYKLPFSVHRGIGPTNERFVCPRSLKKRCPICDERDRLYAEDSDRHKKTISALRAQRFAAYNILDPDNEGQIAILCLSCGKFSDPLEAELKEADNLKHTLFFDTEAENGRTLKVRFTQESYEGRPYLQATRFDFEERAELDEEEVLGKTLVLENHLNVPDYDTLKRAFEHTEEDDDDEKTPEPDDNDDNDNDDDECVACEGTGKSSKGRKCRPCKGTGKKQSDDDDDTDEATTEVDDDDDDEDKAPEANVTKKDEDPDGDDDTIPFENGDDNEIECPECEDMFNEEDAEHSDELDKDFCSKKCLRRAEKKAKSKKDKKKTTKKGKKKDKPEKKKTKKTDEDTPDCPAPDGEFGEVDQHGKYCEDCDSWSECESAST